MNILAQIITDQQQLLIDKKAKVPIGVLKESHFFNTPCKSLVEMNNTQCKTTVIAEFKRKSPSKPIINMGADVIEIVQAYTAHGASAISILTNEAYFGGSIDDVIKARPYTPLPILRKEFIIDDYQIYEAKSIGADIILLIAEAVDEYQCNHLASLAKSLGLEVLLEMHDAKELYKCSEAIDFIGINNRNLTNFTTDIETSLKIVDKLHPNKIWISESGIHSAYDAFTLRKAGYKGLLIGEQFMSSHQPGNACGHFIQSLNTLYNEN